jgi:hypothetical protein
MLLSVTPRIFLSLLAVVAQTTSHATVKRQSTELLNNYDFIIAGGGTSGLTVADRLSEAYPESMTGIKLIKTTSAKQILQKQYLSSNMARLNMLGVSLTRPTSFLEPAPRHGLEYLATSRCRIRK